MREEVGQMGYFRLWRGSYVHQLLKDFKSDGISDEGGVLEMNNIMARY